MIANILFSDTTNSLNTSKSFDNDLKNSNFRTNLLESNAYYNFNKDTLHHISDSNYNSGTLEENNMIKQTYSLQKEITIADMKSILDYIKLKYSLYIISAKSLIKYINEQNMINNNVIAHYLLYQINNRILNLNYSSDKHNFAFFKIDKLLLISDNGVNNISMIKISRKNKIYNFTIEYKVNYKIINKLTHISYNYIKLTGINSDYEFNKYKKDIISNNHAILNNKFNSDIDYNKELNKIHNTIRYNKKSYTNQYDYHNKLYKKQVLYHNKGCFILNNDNTIKQLYINNPIQCKSYWQKYGYNGVWDTKCEKDSDCPFYSPNGNKDNKKRGGCYKQTGVCDMPVGITRIGYRKYLKETKPKCNNCSIDNQYCCSEQLKPSYKFI
jgi:hypothetical protein